jgi:hypothetical protein
VRKKAVPKGKLLAPIIHEPTLLDLMIVPKKEP